MVISLFVVFKCLYASGLSFLALASEIVTTTTDFLTAQVKCNVEVGDAVYWFDLSSSRISSLHVDSNFSVLVCRLFRS